MTDNQFLTLARLCERYKVVFDREHYQPQFDLPSDWVAGWIGGPDHAGKTIYVGCDPDGHCSS